MTAKTTNTNGTNDPAKLREQARKLIEKAEQIERDKLVQIGKLTMKYYTTGFEDMTKFKKELEPLAGALS